MFVLFRFLFRHFHWLILYPFSEWPCLFHHWVQVPLTLQNTSPASSEIQTRFSSLLPGHLPLSTPYGRFKLKSPTIIEFRTASSSKLLYPNMNPLQFYPFWVPTVLPFDQIRKLRLTLSALLLTSNYSAILLSEPLFYVSNAFPHIHGHPRELLLSSHTQCLSPGLSCKNTFLTGSMPLTAPPSRLFSLYK